MSEDKTHVLLTGRPINAQINGVTREITPAIMINRYSFGIGLLYKDDTGKTTDGHWGPLRPALPARCFRAMKILEYVTDFDVESGILCYAWNAASISEVYGSDVDKVKKIESIIGSGNLRRARAEKMSADQIDTLVVNLNKVRYENDGLATFYDFLSFTFEAEGLWPETAVTALYFKDKLPIETEPPLSCSLLPKSDPPKAKEPIPLPEFSDIMKFNRVLWPLFRQKFGYGDFSLEDALKFLGITHEEYLKFEAA